MSRRVTHDGHGALHVRFPFDRHLVDAIKTLPHRRWNADGRYWSVPDLDVVALVDLLNPEGFRFDAATRELYARMGGRSAPDVLPSSGPTLPGLFDAVESNGAIDPAAADVPRDPEAYTVSRLNERVRELLEGAFPGTVWLTGEISGFNKSAHRRHVSFELVERTEGGGVVSKIPATLFESTRREIEQALAAAGDPFRLEDEITVRVRVRVELYVPWGQYRVVVDRLDVNYTLGEAARRREEIVRRLTAAGLVGLNSALPLPPLPLRVGLVTSLGSDAFNDVLRTLQESGFAFRLTAHGARVQGRATEPSVLNALDWFRRRTERFDVLIVCRGGGSRTDLTGFDSEPLGRAVAGFPIPVVVGIGHEQDQSVLDAVGRSCKTPTAAATLLVETVRGSMERLESSGRELLGSALRRIEQERRRGGERARRLAFSTRSLLERERAALDHRRERVAAGSGSLLGEAGRRVSHWAAAIPRLATLRLQEHRISVRDALRTLLRAARREFDGARRELRRGESRLGPSGQRCLRRERERLLGRERRLRSVDPARVLRRGYAILRLEDGRVLTEARMAPAGTPVRAELKKGRLKLRSDGQGGDEES
jgi:exodeoxyribonuclease VII large subunit